MNKIYLFLLLLTFCAVGQDIEDSPTILVQTQINDISAATESLEKEFNESTIQFKELNELNELNELDTQVSSQVDRLKTLTSKSVSSPEVGKLLKKGFLDANRLEGELPKRKAEIQNSLSEQRSLAIQSGAEMPGNEIPVAAEEHNQQELKRLLKTRNDLNLTLQKKRSNLILALEKNEQLIIQVIEQVTNLRKFSISRLFWYKNGKALWNGFIFERDAPSQFLERLKSFALIELNFTNNSASRNFLGAAIVVPFLIFIAFLTLKRVNSENEQTLVPTLFFSILYALYPAFFLILLGRYCSSQISPEVTGVRIGTFLEQLGYFFAILLPTLTIFSPKGELSQKFNLPSELLKWVKKYTLIITIAYFVLVIFSKVLLAGLPKLEGVITTLHLVFTLFLAYILCVRALSRKEAFACHLLAGKHLLRKNWGAVRSVIVLLLSACFILGLLGYHFAWNTLLNAIIQSVIFVAFITLFYPTIRRALLRTAKSKGENWDSVIQKEHSEEQDLNKERDERKKRLNRTGAFVDNLFVILILIAFTFIWNSDGVLGYAFSQLEIFSWKSGENITILTLQGAIIAAGVLISAILLVRSLPSFFELFVFPRFHIEAGVSYAIISISRYLLFTIALLIFFAYLKVDLSKIGWLVAALGVGLGFGLQEIVSNFVCGLILLVERPVRVGDIVTIDGVSGIVSKINIRSTTVTDWNKLENVIPNKTFVTQKLTNWSLSNQMSRIVVPIGVAYGTDPERIKDILLSVANADKRICQDPPPLALFLRHGESSLDFELRVYIDDFSHRIWVEDSLVTEVNRALVKEKIEIPFPQRDLHLRSGELPTI